MTFNAFFFQKSHMVIFREIKNMTFFDDSFIKSHTFMFEIVYCRIKIPKVAERFPESCMRKFPIFAPGRLVPLQAHI